MPDQQTSSHGTEFAYMPTPAASDGGSHRRRKHHRKKRKTLKIVAIIVAVLLVLCCVFGVLLFQSAKSLQSQASSAMSNVSAVSDSIAAGDYNKAATNAASLKTTAADMKSEISSPLWGIASMLPVVGSDISGMKTVVSVLDDASANALVPLTSDLKQAPPSHLVLSDGTIDVAATQTLLASIKQAAPVMERCNNELSSVAPMNIPQLEKVMGPAKEKFATFDNAFQQADAFSSVVNSFLGADGERTYLLAAQNSAEIRATGGFPGSVGILKISGGKLELGAFDTVYNLFNEDTPSAAGITDTENKLFGTSYLRSTWDTGFDPDFTVSAKAWTASYEERNYATVDGVISITPSMVQDVLAITGGITLSDGTQMDGTNASKVLQHDLYWKYLSATPTAEGGNDACDKLFSEAAELSFEKLLSNMSSSTLMKFASSMVTGLDNRTVMLWLSNPDEQAAIAPIGCSGELSTDPTKPEIGVYFNMQEAAKLGWYLDIDNSISAGTQNADGTTSYQVVTTFKNTAKSSEVEPGGHYIMGEPMTGDMAPNLYLTAPAGGSITGLTSSNGATLSSSTYQDLQIECLIDTSLKPGASIALSYTVTTSASAKSDLGVSVTPTLTQYR